MKCGHHIIWTCRVDSLFSSCPGTPKDISSLSVEQKNQVEDRDSLKVLPSAGKGDVVLFHTVCILFCVFYESLGFGGTACFQGISNFSRRSREQAEVNKTTSLSQFSAMALPHLDQNAEVEKFLLMSFLCPPGPLSDFKILAFLLRSFCYLEK